MSPTLHHYLLRSFSLFIFIVLYSINTPSVSASYRAPDMDKELFASDEIEIDKFSKAGLVGALVSIARDFNAKNHQVSLDTRSYALAIAGRLDKDSKRVEECLDQLLAEWQTKPQLADKGRTADRLYSGIRSLMRRKDNKANQVCAAYCISIAIAITPDTSKLEKLKEYQESLAKAGYVANWEGILKAAVPRGNNSRQPTTPLMNSASVVMTGGKAQKLARLQSQLHGLYHTVPQQFLDQDKQATPIILKAVKDADQKEILFEFNHKVGIQVTESLEQAVKFLEGLYSDAKIPSGYKVTISMNHLGSPRDHLKQGIPLAIAIDSLFTGAEIDEQFTCIGRINQHGESGSIRGIPRAINDAINKNHTIIGIPFKDRIEAYDFLLLQGIEQLLKINIFTQKNFADAKKQALKNKDSDTKKAISLYAEIGELIKKRGPKILHQPETKNKLRSILDKAPNHICAEILLDISNNKLEKKLSVRGSAAEIYYYIGIYGSNLSSTQTQQRALQYVNHLNNIRELIDPFCMDYYRASITLQTSISEGPKNGESPLEYKKRIDALNDKVTAIRKKTFSNPKVQNAIRRGG